MKIIQSINAQLIFLVFLIARRVALAKYSFVIIVLLSMQANSYSLEPIFAVPSGTYEKPWQFIDRQGNQVFPEMFRNAKPLSMTPFKKDLRFWVVREEEQWEVIQKSGKRTKIPIPYQSNYVTHMGGPLFLAVCRKNEEYFRSVVHSQKGEVGSYPEVSYCFSEGLFAFQNEDNKWGYANEYGDVVISPRFHDADFFSEGVAAVTEEAKKEEEGARHFGYIDHNGDYLIEPLIKAYRAYPFRNRRAKIQKIKKQGEHSIPVFSYIDPLGKDPFGKIYHTASTFSCGLARVGEGKMEINILDRSYFEGKEGFIDTEGNWVVQPGNTSTQTLVDNIGTISGSYFTRYQPNEEIFVASALIGPYTWGVFSAGEVNEEVQLVNIDGKVIWKYPEPDYDEKWRSHVFLGLYQYGCHYPL